MKKLIILLTLVSCSLSVKAENNYVPPLADFNEGSSPPCVTGTIKALNDKSVIVSTDAKKILSVSITESTEMFTVYGGIVFKHQLVPLLNIKIWFKGKSCNEPVLPLEAHTIMFVSKTPSDTWP